MRDILEISRSSPSALVFFVNYQCWKLNCNLLGILARVIPVAGVGNSETAMMPEAPSWQGTGRRVQARLPMQIPATPPNIQPLPSSSATTTRDKLIQHITQALSKALTDQL